MKIQAYQCDFCGAVEEYERDFETRIPLLELHFCSDSERDRYVREASTGERAAVLEAINEEAKRSK